MAMYIPAGSMYAQKDPFGGPAGSTQAAVEQILKGILVGQEKNQRREQDQFVADLFQQSQNQKNVADPYSGMTDPYGSGQPSQTPFNSQSFTDMLLSNKEVLPETRDRWLKNANVLSEMDYRKQKAQADLEAARNRDVKYEDIWYRNPKTDKTSKLAVPVRAFNQTVAKLEDAGMEIIKEPPAETWNAPEKKGNTWIQKSTTGKIQKAYDEEDGYSKPYKDADGNLVQDNIRTGKQEMLAKAPEDSGSNQISAKKNAAWDAYFAGKATPEQERMIGVDVDRNTAEAARMVSDDPNMLFVPVEKKIEKVQEIADLMRKGRNQNPQAGAKPTGKKRMTYVPGKGFVEK